MICLTSLGPIIGMTRDDRSTDTFFIHCRRVMLVNQFFFVRHHPISSSFVTHPLTVSSSAKQNTPPNNIKILNYCSFVFFLDKTKQKPERTEIYIHCVVRSKQQNRNFFYFFSYSIIICSRIKRATKSRWVVLV